MLGSGGSALSVASSLIAEGVMRLAKQEDWDVIDLASWHLVIPDRAKVDGVIYITNKGKGSVLEPVLDEIPCRVKIYEGNSALRSPRVAVDQTAMGQMAAEYYLERGFRNFALAAYKTSEWDERLIVFKERIEKAGGRCQSIKGLHMTDEDPIAVADSVREQLRDLTYPLGIFCTNDRLALRLCRWCLDEGIAVPEQAAILGCDNDTVACKSSSVPLSSIDMNYELQGFEAARLLQRMMEGEAVPEDTIIRIPPQGIITRRSTDITALEDTHAAMALRYIWDHYRENIGPDDIAAYCGLPRRTLEIRFKKALGKTLMREVMRQRLNKARELLTGGNMPAVDIAARLGFGTPQYFNFQFKKRFGVPPKEYRKRERGKTET